MADEKAIFVPSGDQSGRLSGPAWVTSGRIAASATVTMEMSIVWLLEGSGLIV